MVGVTTGRSGHLQRERLRRAGPAIAMGLAALAAYAVYGGGYVSVDPMVSLMWGRELAQGEMPSIAQGGPTPHPLSNLVGAALAPLGAGAAPALLAISYLSLAALAYATWLVARSLGGVPAGAVAVVLLLTRDLVAGTTALAFLDIPFAALVMAAVALELHRPRRGWPVLALLAVAGLLRPEAWFLAGFYWLWLLPRLSRRDAARAALLVASAPVLWVAADLAATGDPLFSLHGTQHGADRVTIYGSGPVAALTEGPRAVLAAAGRGVALTAVIGLALLWWLRRRPAVVMVGVLGAVSLATFIPVVAGTLINPRYLIPLVALLCALSGAAVGGWLKAPRHQGAWGVAAAGCALLLAVTAIAQVERLRGLRQEVQATAQSYGEARELLTGDLPCAPLVFPNSRLTAYAAVWREMDRSLVVDASTAGTVRGTYVFGTADALEGTVFLPDRHRGVSLPRPPRWAQPVRSEGGWTLYDACSRPPAG